MYILQRHICVARGGRKGRKFHTSVRDKVVHSKKTDTTRVQQIAIMPRYFVPKVAPRHFVAAAKIAALSISLQAEQAGRTMSCTGVRNLSRNPNDNTKANERRAWNHGDTEPDKGLLTSGETRYPIN